MKESQSIVNNNNSALDTPLNETTNLWVDLYKPRRYLELLSDESINRILLKWTKLWDKVVFNRRPKVKIITQQNFNKFDKFKKQELVTTLDEFGRPEHKIALLCGPPGLGKASFSKKKFPY